MRKMFGKLSGDLKIESKVDDCFYEGFVDGLFIKFRSRKNNKDKQVFYKGDGREIFLKAGIAFGDLARRD